MKDASYTSGRPSFGCPYTPANRRPSFLLIPDGGGKSVEARLTVTRRGAHVGRESKLCSEEREDYPSKKFMTSLVSPALLESIDTAKDSQSTRSSQKIT